VSKVLIIDDDKIFQFILKKRIENINDSIEILAVENGNEALDAFRDMLTHNLPLPQDVFIDLNMPVIDGWQFLDEIEKIIPDIADKVNIYVCSTSIAPDDKVRALSYKIVKDFLIKDIADEDLVRIIYELTGKA
jgi:CheY-like chemotaxis protein